MAVSYYSSISILDNVGLLMMIILFIMRDLNNTRSLYNNYVYFSKKLERYNVVSNRNKGVVLDPHFTLQKFRN